MESFELRKKEKTVMYSTSIPKAMKDSLQKAVGLIHRKKADCIRAALHLFFMMDEKRQEDHILEFFREISSTQLRPFTTTLLEGQLNQLNNMSKSLKRSKAEIVRTAIFIFLNEAAEVQEKEIKKYLSR